MLRPLYSKKNILYVLDSGQGGSQKNTDAVGDRKMSTVLSILTYFGCFQTQYSKMHYTTNAYVLNFYTFLLCTQIASSAV
jgi:hypothetical protein